MMDAVVEDDGCCHEEAESPCAWSVQRNAAKQCKRECLQNQNPCQKRILPIWSHSELCITRRYRVAQTVANGRRTSRVAVPFVSASTRPIGMLGGKVVELLDVTMMSPDWN